MNGVMTALTETPSEEWIFSSSAVFVSEMSRSQQQQQPVPPPPLMSAPLTRHCHLTADSHSLNHGSIYDDDKQYGLKQKK